MLASTRITPRKPRGIFTMIFDPTITCRPLSNRPLAPSLCGVGRKPGRGKVRFHQPNPAVPEIPQQLVILLLALSRAQITLEASISARLYTQSRTTWCAGEYLTITRWRPGSCSSFSSIRARSNINMEALGEHQFHGIGSHGRSAGPHAAQSTRSAPPIRGMARVMASPTGLCRHLQLRTLRIAANTRAKIRQVPGAI